MGGNKARDGKTAKRYRIEFSRTTVVLWSAGGFVLLAFFFTLGVLAGRGLLPGGISTLAELKAQIGRLQQMISSRDRSELERIKELHKDTKFRFYDELSERKGDTIGKTPSFVGRKKGEPGPGQRQKNGTASSRYVVQVASLDSEDRAAAMVKRLIRRGYPAYFYKVFVKGRRYFRVRCGMYGTRAEAVDIKKRLARDEKLDCLIKKVKDP